MEPSARLKIALSAVLTIFIAGTLGFHYLEGWTFADSFYFTVATLSTVGYGDFSPHTALGKWFTISIIILGVGTMLYSFGLVSEMVIEGRLRRLLGRGKMERMIDKLSNHYIVCGGGRIGYHICRELAHAKVPYLVVDQDPEVIQKMEDEGLVYCKGDATHDKTLLEAGIKRAKGVICVLPSDAENLYVILTAKELNRNVYILSRSEEEESEHRLLRAGADRVMSPYTLGGVRMAMAILRPAMLDFIEITTGRQSLELRMEEIAVCEGSPYIGQTLEDSGIRKRFGLIIIAVKKGTDKMIFNPMASYVIATGDHLIAMGEEENVRQFSESCLI